MPVSQETVQITYKLLPLILQADGTASVVVRRGLQYQDGKWESIGEKTIIIDNPETVSLILDAPPVEGMTRRDDLCFAIYNYLVSIGEVSGVVS